MQRYRILFLICVGFSTGPSGWYAIGLRAQVSRGCRTPQAESTLEINNVRARLVNNGGLFYGGDSHTYGVPRFSMGNAVFEAGLVVSGIVDGEVRTAASRSGQWEFWAGPLNDQGYPPVDCSKFDRLYRISRLDIEEFELTGHSVPDLADWPTGLGAPTIDSRGNPVDVSDLSYVNRLSRTIDLAAGERPAMEGDQSVWWIMNDRGSRHAATGSQPLGIEVQVTAYAARTSNDPVNNATLYRYRIINRSSKYILGGRIGLYVDPDLGYSGDDFVGTDSLLHMVYVYNGDNEDVGGEEAYGTPPPALGIVVLQGPLADADGRDSDYDGLIDEAGERHGLSNSMVIGGGDGPAGTPHSGLDYYRYLNGLWKDNRPLSIGGFGYNEKGKRSRFAYPGDPVQRRFWSEVNIDRSRTMNIPSDRRFIMSTGPVRFRPGEMKEVSYAIVWTKGTDNLDSVNELRKAARSVQQAWNRGFKDFPPGDPPLSTVSLLSPADGATGQPLNAMLRWTPSVGDEGYQIELLVPDTTYTLSSRLPELELELFASEEVYAWRVRTRNAHGFGAWSTLWYFTTGSSTISAPSLLFRTVANAAGALAPADLASFAIDGSGFPSIACPTDTSSVCETPTPGYQQATNASIWGVHAGGADRDFSSFLFQATRGLTDVSQLEPAQYEWRWIGPGNGGLVWDPWDGAETFDAGFELWNIGLATPDDPLDDYRMIPIVCTSCGGRPDGPLDVFDIGGDHPISSGFDDPATDWVYFYDPVDTSPGESGFNDFFFADAPLGREVFARIVLVQMDGGHSPPYDVELPETGTVFRISTDAFPSPIPAAPAPEATIQAGTVVFRWSGSLNDRFRIQISNDLRFSLVIADDTTSSMQWSDSLTVNGRYYWRIQSRNGKWSTIWTFDLTGGPTGIAVQENADLPDRFRLIGHYPNPVYESAAIRFETATAGDVRIELFDVLGRRLRTLVNERKPAGEYTVRLDATGLPGGTYFYRMEAGRFLASRSITVVR